jgi:hypothetical protein
MPLEQLLFGGVALASCHSQQADYLIHVVVAVARFSSIERGFDSALAIAGGRHNPSVQRMSAQAGSWEIASWLGSHAAAPLVSEA